MSTRFAFSLFTALSVCTCAYHKPTESSCVPGDQSVSIEGRAPIHIETTGFDGEKRSPHYWVVSGAEQVPLPDLPHPDFTTCPGAHFSISSDQQWIFANEKLYRRANEVWLLRRDTSLHYSLVGEPTFGRAALAYYMPETSKLDPSECSFITRIGPWPKNGNLIRLTLYAEGWLDIALCYDLKTGSFSISDDQTTTYY